MCFLAVDDDSVRKFRLKNIIYVYILELLEVAHVHVYSK